MKVSYIQPSTPESTHEGWDDIATYKGYPNLHCKILGDRGHTVESIWLTRDDTASSVTHEWGHRIRRFPVTVGEQYGREYSFQLMKYLSTTDADLLHFRGYPQHNIPPFLPFLSIFKPVVVQQMGQARTYSRDRTKDRIMMRLLKFADMVTALYSDEIDNLIDAGFPESKTSHLPNAVNTELFYPMSKQDAASTLNMSPDRRYIVYVGRLVSRKNAPQLVSAMEEVVKHYSEATLLVVGDGPESELEKIYQIIERADLEENVQLEGHRPQHELSSYYNIADAAVFPSSIKGLPMVALEAGACNVPIIATPAFRNTVLEPQENCLFVNQENTDSISEGILELLEDPSLAADLAEQAHTDILAGYHPDAIYERVMKVYRKAIKHHHG